jgi:hypothetical protein
MNSVYLAFQRYLMNLPLCEVAIGDLLERFTPCALPNVTVISPVPVMCTIGLDLWLMVYS